MENQDTKYICIFTNGTTSKFAALYSFDDKEKGNTISGISLKNSVTVQGVYKIGDVKTFKVQ